MKLTEPIPTTAVTAALLALLPFLLITSTATSGTLSGSLESGAVWFGLNDVRVPGGGEDGGNAGDKFDLTALTGTGPDAYARLYLTYTINERHLLRLLYAPLEVEGIGTLGRATRFREATFLPGIDTEGTYEFSTYRLTYRYAFHQSAAWQWGIGGAVLIRDAAITLRQGDLKTTESNVGLVPLLHLHGLRRFGDHASASFDLEGLGAPQGRAIDAALAFNYEPTDRLTLSVGYRTLEGGADNDKVYTFAWIHYAMLAVTYRP